MHCLSAGVTQRGVSYEIIKNRGLTPHKSKLNRNPRVKKREAYRKAVIRRKGQVVDVSVLDLHTVHYACAITHSCRNQHAVT